MEELDNLMEEVQVSMKIAVHKVVMNAPDDMHGIINLIENNTVKPDEIVAIIVKTEGNGNVNDFTRGFATYVIQSLLARYLKCSKSMVSEKVSIVWSKTSILFRSSVHY